MLSPNFGERRGGVAPDLVVLHYTGMESCAAAHARLCDPAFEVSAHYLISEQGAVLPLVDEAKRAWHAGAGSWGGVTDVNSRSIGIELANGGGQPFVHRQIVALEALLADVMTRWSISPERVIAHADMAPARKTDPGARFDWQRLARAGLSVWPKAAKLGQPDDFAALACQFGYPDVEDALILQAFRLRFRPWAMGPCDAVDAGLITDLATRFPVDGAARHA
jgi:N-acetylmuramoyl-L-alanine amidase